MVYEYICHNPTSSADNLYNAPRKCILGAVFLFLYHFLNIIHIRLWEEIAMWKSLGEEVFM